MSSLSNLAEHMAERLVPDRIVWQIRRYTLAKSVPGFWAHWDSYATKNCHFSEHNYLYMKTRLKTVSLGRFCFVAGAKVGYTDIGAFSAIGPEAMVGGLGKHATNFLSSHPAF